MIYPYIKYFLVKYEKRDVTYDELYKEHLKSTMDYYNKFGKDGFLSERIFLKDVSKIAEREARREFDSNEKCVGSIECVMITEDNEKEEMRLIENRRDFIKWI